MSMTRALLSALSPAGPRARLSVLIFHRVLFEPDPLFPGEPDRVRFDTVCGWLKRWFNVLPLDAAVQRLQLGTLPSRAAAITFDDGYADNCAVAMPILQRHGLSATFFVASGFLDGGRMWNDTVIESIRRTAQPTLDLTDLLELPPLPLDTLERRRAAIDAVVAAVKYLDPARRQALVESIAARARITLPTDLMMSSSQVRALRAGGMDVGAHTSSHPILARLSRAEARDEIVAGKRTLENILGQTVPLFAYPNGKPGEDYSDETVELAREAGFAAAVSTARGAARQGADVFQLPRFTPWDRSGWRFGARLVANLRHAA
jgi:peptidoglycan/xylan/chitin deacetylase (PgdA/CDA1 family)